MKGFNFVLGFVVLALLGSLFASDVEAGGFRFRQRQQQRAFNQGFHAAQRLQQQQLQLQLPFHR